MSLIQYDPFRGFEGLTRRMSSFFDDFDNNFGIERSNFSPKVDISEDENSINIYAELPGLKKEDVKVTINDDNVLVIKGEKSHEKKEENNDNDENKPVFLRVERSFGSFTRSFVLPENVDKESIKGNFSNGILSIALAKKEPEKPKELEIAID